MPSPPETAGDIGNQIMTGHGVMTLDMQQQEPGIPFSAVRGGPRYDFQRRLGLLGEHDLGAGSRAVLIAALASPRLAALKRTTQLFVL